MNIVIPPLSAEPIFHLGSFPVTNAYINSTLLVLALVLGALYLKSKFRAAYAPGAGAPGGFVGAVEAIVEGLTDFFSQVTRDRARAVRFLPLVGSLFLFILLSNWAGLIPGTGTITVVAEHNGALEALPLFRPANTDLNMTLAMAVLAVVASHLTGIVALGFLEHAGKFLQVQKVWKALLALSPVAILTAVIEFFVGIIEIFSEIAKMVSLSLRLFGNIFAGEVLLTVLAGLLPFFVPLPFMFLEIIVGLVQAVVFSTLACVYLTMATESHGGSHEEHAPAH